MAVVLFSALVVAVESVGVEVAINTLGVAPFTVAIIPSVVAGLVLLTAMPRATRTIVTGLGGRGWLFMIATCLVIAAGVFMWFDAVGRIGASKEAILGGGSSEVLFIVLLSAIFLSERLTKIEFLGSAFVLLGVFLVLANADPLSPSLGFGEIEAIVSSFLLAISVIMTAMLLRSHRLTPVSGLELLVSGGLLLAVGIPFGLVSWPGNEEFLALVALGGFPAVGILTYYAGVPRIGASLTSVLFALTGIMTVGVQVLVLRLVPGAEMILPRSLPLTLAGGAVAFAGVYLLNSGKGEHPPSGG
jgi:drug/metabolite transporter (DMT)-like permease